MAGPIRLTKRHGESTGTKATIHGSAVIYRMTIHTPRRRSGPTGSLVGPFCRSGGVPGRLGRPVGSTPQKVPRHFKGIWRPNRGVKRQREEGLLGKGST